MDLSAAAVFRSASTPASSFGGKNSIERSGRRCAKSSERGRSVNGTYQRI
jgi:hypothetical protein